jgi:hypothetical protein
MGWVVSVTLRPRFCPKKMTPGTHCTGCWVDHRAGLDTEDRGKILCLCRGSNLDRPVVQPVARDYTDWATPANVLVYTALKLISTCQHLKGHYCRVKYRLSLQLQGVQKSSNPWLTWNLFFGRLISNRLWPPRSPDLSPQTSFMRAS